MATINRKKHVIDATGMAPGRLASMVATLLMGKHKVSYVLHRDMGDKVLITNVDKMVFTGKKLEQKDYKHHTMHPGGLKSVMAKKVLLENPDEVLTHAVAKMIPKNKHRTDRLRRLTFGKA